MPQLGFQVLSALVLLLPGFLCALVVRSLCVRPKQTEFDKIVEALVYTFVVYLAFAIIAGPDLPLGFKTEVTNGVQRYGIEFDRKRLLILGGLPFLLAFLIGLDKTNDYSARLFRKLRLTQRTTHSSVWSDTFHGLKGVVQVELADGRRIVGWLRFYSDEPDDASLFLEKAHWITPDNKLVPVPGSGTLITQSCGIRYVMFLDDGVCETPNTTDNAKGVSAGA